MSAGCTAGAGSVDGAYLVEGVAHFERHHLAQEGECMVCSPAVDVVSAADAAARCQWMSVLYVRDTVHVGYGHHARAQDKARRICMGVFSGPLQGQSVLWAGCLRSTVSWMSAVEILSARRGPPRSGGISWWLVWCRGEGKLIGRWGEGCVRREGCRQGELQWGLALRVTVRRGGHSHVTYDYVCVLQNNHCAPWTESVKELDDGPRDVWSGRPLEEGIGADTTGFEDASRADGDR